MSFYQVQPLPDANSRQPTTQIRMPSSSLLCIDSEDRYANYTDALASSGTSPTTLNSTPYDFTLSKAENLMAGFITRLGVSEINFPFGIPNINVKTQSIIVLYNDGVTDISGVITLPISFYTPHQLAAELQNAILTAFPVDLSGMTVQYGSPSGVLNVSLPIFSYSSPEQISFLPLPYNTDAYPYPSTTRQLFDVLGFEFANTQLAYTRDGGFTFCQFTRYIDICCYQLTNQQALKDQMSQSVARDVLCRIYFESTQTTIQPNDPLFCPPSCAPHTIYRNYTVPKQIQWQPYNNIPGFLRFTVYDDAGAPLTEAIANLGAVVPGAYMNWSMTMLASEN